MNRESALGIIPARYGSTRLPGKPLLEIGGMPLILHVLKQAQQAASLRQVLVATDHRAIVATVQSAGGQAVLTPEHLQSGTDRCAYAAKDLNDEIIINIQGDEPFIDPAAIDQVVHLLRNNKKADMATLVRKLDTPGDLTDPHKVKVAVSREGKALYFSRSAIPFCREVDDPEQWPEHGDYFIHLGLYGYRKDFILRFCSWAPTPLERTEKLEQLRALEMGAEILIEETDMKPFGIDTEEDLHRARKKFDGSNLARTH